VPLTRTSAAAAWTCEPRRTTGGHTASGVRLAWRTESVTGRSPGQGVARREARRGAVLRRGWRPRL